MTKEQIKCGKCGNDGTKGSLYLTIDAKWNGDVWELEEREDDGGMELDCLECDHRTDVRENPGVFPYRMQLKIGNLAASIVRPSGLLGEALEVIRAYYCECSGTPRVNRLLELQDKARTLLTKAGNVGQ